MKVIVSKHKNFRGIVIKRFFRLFKKSYFATEEKYPNGYNWMAFPEGKTISTVKSWSLDELFLEHYKD